MTADAAIQLTDEQIAWLRGLKMSKRAAIVRDYILEHGAITTEKLSELGYNHPPRAARDLKDAGAGVRSVLVNVGGKRIASYTFDGKANEDEAGRIVIPKEFADRLKAAFDHRCAICAAEYPDRYLQADHRVPFAIAGDKPTFEVEDFMPLCPSDNRAKSWSCEHCPNWTIRHAETCERCFWAHPEDYTHVETRPERRLTVTFQGNDVASYDDLKRAHPGEDVAVVVRDMIEEKY